jgi:hypothetical protein
VDRDVWRSGNWRHRRWVVGPPSAPKRGRCSCDDLKSAKLADLKTPKYGRRRHNFRSDAGNPGVFGKASNRVDPARPLHSLRAGFIWFALDRTSKDFQARPIHGAVYPAKICNPARESFLRRGRNTLQADATAPCIFLSASC